MKYPIINVIDLEMLCWEGEHKNFPEIIEFALVEVSLKELKIKKEVQIYCKPELGGSVSQFCYDLTGISQKRLNKSNYTLKSALELVNKKYGFQNRPLFTWGNDILGIKDELQKKEIEFELPKNVFNLSTLNTIFKNDNKSTSLESALKEKNIEFEGVPHNGLADARNTAKLVLEFLKKNKL